MALQIPAEVPSAMAIRRKYWKLKADKPITSSSILDFSLPHMAMEALFHTNIKFSDTHLFTLLPGLILMN